MSSPAGFELMAKSFTVLDPQVREPKLENVTPGEQNIHDWINMKNITREELLLIWKLDHIHDHVHSSKTAMLRGTELEKI